MALDHKPDCGPAPAAIPVSDAARLGGGDLAEPLENMWVEINNVAVMQTEPDCPRDFDMFIVTGGLRMSYATLGAFMKYPKESLPKKPTTHIADKKFGFFQSEKDRFREVAEELGLKQTRPDTNAEGDNISFSRHPLTFLVEAADDICYTIIDFEDGINLGLISEEFALEYLIKLVKDNINTKKYNSLAYKEDRLSYLRALAINTLITDAIRIFLANEEAILITIYRWVTTVNHNRSAL